MEFLGTKGKWIIGKNVSNKWIDLKNKKGNNIAEAKSYGIIPLEELEANALLISKAPEMLEMLEKLLVTFSGDELELYQLSRLKELEQLIKEATTLK